MRGCLMMFGLARKAGCLVVGEDNIRAAVNDRKAKAVFTAADATPNAQKKAKNFAEAGHIPCIEMPCTKDELGSAAGGREIAAAAITNPEIASGLAEKLRAEDPEKYGEAADFLLYKAKAKREREKMSSPRRSVKRKENA